jgi:hypothetical protein
MRLGPPLPPLTSPEAFQARLAAEAAKFRARDRITGARTRAKWAAADADLRAALAAVPAVDAERVLKTVVAAQAALVARGRKASRPYRWKTTRASHSDADAKLARDLAAMVRQGIIDKVAADEAAAKRRTAQARVANDQAILARLHNKLTR